MFRELDQMLAPPPEEPPQANPMVERVQQARDRLMGMRPQSSPLADRLAATAEALRQVKERLFGGPNASAMQPIPRRPHGFSNELLDQVKEQRARDPNANTYPFSFSDVTPPEFGPQTFGDPEARQKQIDYVAPMAGAAMTGGMPFAARGSAGIFGGRLSATADQAALRKAPRVSVFDEVLAGRNNEPVKRFVVEQDGMKGRLAVTPDGVVRNVFLHPELRGQGYGRSMYEAAIDHFANLGLPLRSEAAVSADAARVYKSLQKRGYPVTRGGQGEPAFTVGLRPRVQPIKPEIIAE